MAGVSCLIDPFMFECQIKQHCFTMCRVLGELYVISNESLVSSFLQVDELDEKCHLLSSYAKLLILSGGHGMGFFKKFKFR